MRVLLVDGHPKVRWALRTFIQEELEFTVVGEASDAATMFSQTWLLQPDLIVLEWELAGLRMDRLLPALCALAPTVRVIVLSSRAEAEQDAIRAGAIGFASKANGPEKLLLMLRRLEKKTIRRTVWFRANSLAGGENGKNWDRDLPIRA